jgi:putative ABC transport system permease protein
LRIQDFAGITFSNLWRRKLRSFLTILAVVIGATLIGLMVSLSNGIQTFIVYQFGLFIPQNTLFVANSQNAIFGGGQGGFDGQPQPITGGSSTLPRPLTTANLNSIRSIPGIQQVDYFVTVQAESIRVFPDGTPYTVTLNTGPDYQLRLRQLVAGDYFAADATGECLLPLDYVSLFGWQNAQNAVGKEVIIEVGKINPFDNMTNQYHFTVAGITETSVSGNLVQVSMPDAIEMARFYADDPRLYSEEQPGLVLQVAVQDTSLVPEVTRSIENLGMGVISSSDILERVGSVFNIIQAGLFAFGIIALVVAAIGIINTLLMAVYERTREVGLMKAIGATRNTIRSIFTAEGAFIGFLGGIIGVILAWLIGQIINAAGVRTFLSDFPSFTLIIFPLWLAPAIITLTTLISLIAALYPANRAARLDPVEALRYE